ncbi:MAG: hypothetical protein QOI83_1137 [Streptomycetaceae bacterium]|nr:hypothetical protein [Streptomycetaceae bacterium]
MGFVEYVKTLWPVFAAGSAVTLGRFSHIVKANGRRYSTLVAFHFNIEAGHLVRLHLPEDSLVAGIVTAGD